MVGVVAGLFSAVVMVLVPSVPVGAVEVPPVVEVDLVRTLELDEVGIDEPVAVSVSADGLVLSVVDAADPGSARDVSVAEVALGSSRDDVSALDDHRAVGEDGSSYVVSGVELRVSGPGGDRVVDLGGVLEGPAAGVDSAGDGSVFVGDPVGSRVVVLDASFEVDRVLDVGAAGVGELRDLAVAPSGDQTDAPDALSVYVVDGLASEAGSRPAVVELTTEAAGTVAAAAVVDTDVATVVQTVDTGNAISPPSPDSAGLTWMPGTNRLVMADSEVNEYPYYAGTNLWQLTPTNPAAVTNTGTTVGLFSNEPTGIAYDAANDRYFVTDDNRRVVNEVLVGADKIPGTADDTFVKRFDTIPFGLLDPEGIAYDSRRGWLHVADGSNAEIWTIRPGPNGRFDGGGDDVITSFDTSLDGIRDPEGVAYDSVTDTLAVVDYRGSLAGEYAIDGTLERFIDLAAADPFHLAGATWAPSSTGSGRSLWAVDRGIDASEPRDGFLYEFRVPAATVGTDPDIFVAPSSFSFGPVQTNTTAAGSLSVSNVGDVALTVSSITLGGTDASSFELISGGGGFTVQPGAAVEVDLEFSPTAQRSYSARLTIRSNDPGESQVTVPLSGDGVPAGVAQVALESLTDGGSTATPAVSTDVPVPFVSDRLYVAYISAKNHASVTGIAGLGGSWSAVAQQCAGRSQTGTSVFVSKNASSSSPVTASFAATPSNAVIVVAEYSGVDLATPIGSVARANSNGVSGGCSGGVDAASYSFGLPSASTSSLVAVSVATRNATHAAGGGFTEKIERSQGIPGSAANVAVADRPTQNPGSVTVAGSMSGAVDWAAIAIEIRPRPTGPDPGDGRPVFDSSPLTINGTYEPVVGDFNGDDRSDILWYAPGSAGDYLWTGKASGGFTSTPTTINGTYVPVVGFFNGDGLSDILWYAPGSAGDYLWTGKASGGFTSTPTTINGTYVPVVGFLNDDALSDILWYAPGAAGDYFWTNDGVGGFTSTPTTINGTYVPVVGDFNGDGLTDIIWYAAGSANDYLWTNASS